MSSSILELRSLPAYPALLNPQDLSEEERSALRKEFARRAPEQDKIATDLLNTFDKAYYRHEVCTWELAFVLTTALAGRNLTEKSASSLRDDLIELFDFALASKLVERSQEPLRIGVKHFHRRLVALGVSELDAGIVERNLHEAAFRSLAPPRSAVRPIPPGPKKSRTPIPD